MIFRFGKPKSLFALGLVYCPRSGVGRSPTPSSTVAGSSLVGDGGKSLERQLSDAQCLAIDRLGNVYYRRSTTHACAGESRGDDRVPWRFGISRLLAMAVSAVAARSTRLRTGDDLRITNNRPTWADNPCARYPPMGDPTVRWNWAGRRRRDGGKASRRSSMARNVVADSTGESEHLRIAWGTAFAWSRRDGASGRWPERNGRARGEERRARWAELAYPAGMSLDFYRDTI